MAIYSNPNFYAFFGAFSFNSRFSFQRGDHRDVATLSQLFGEAIMPLKKPIKPVIPNLVRKIPPSFAWIDHRLRSRQFLLDFEPGEFALYLFLTLAADEQGLSCWRLDIMQRTIRGISHISKRGSPLLRWALYMAAIAVYKKHRDFGKIYLRHTKQQPKGRRQKGHRYALIAVAHKVARVTWRLMKDNRPFTKNPQKREC